MLFTQHYSSPTFIIQYAQNRAITHHTIKPGIASSHINICGYVVDHMIKQPPKIQAVNPSSSMLLWVMIRYPLSLQKSGAGLCASP
jgi:hypothetical protein